MEWNRGCIKGVAVFGLFASYLYGAPYALLFVLPKSFIGDIFFELEFYVPSFQVMLVLAAAAMFTALIVCRRFDKWAFSKRRYINIMNHFLCWPVTVVMLLRVPMILLVALFAAGDADPSRNHDESPWKSFTYICNGPLLLIATVAVFTGTILLISRKSLPKAILLAAYMTEIWLFLFLTQL